jgi:hypothetical protein
MPNIDEFQYCKVWKTKNCLHLSDPIDSRKGRGKGDGIHLAGVGQSDPAPTKATRSSASRDRARRIALVVHAADRCAFAAPFQVPVCPKAMLGRPMCVHSRLVCGVIRTDL